MIRYHNIKFFKLCVAYGVMNSYQVILNQVDSFRLNIILYSIVNVEPLPLIPIKDGKSVARWEIPSGKYW